MKFEIENGSFTGTAEWQAPGRVALEMDDAQQRAFLEDYFAAEDSFMAGPVDSGEMQMERRDESPEAFTRAAQMLAAYSYRVRQREVARRASHGKES